MKSIKMLATSGVTAVAIAATIASPVLACHPQGKIVKNVQDVTLNSASVEANTEASALIVNKGDILTYTVTVSNQETVTGKNGEDQMVDTKLTDTLPKGVELASDPAKTTITENLGNIKAKGSVTKQYQVKVTSNEEGAVLTNKACYISTSKLGSKYNQSGCDVAIVKVHVPETPVTPPTTPSPTKPTPKTPEAPVKQEAPKALPNTGAGNVVVLGALVSALGYAGSLVFFKRRATVQN